MFSWVQLVIALLKVVNSIMTWARERELITQGHDAAIAEAAAEIMKKTTAGKKILEKVNAMSDADVDAELSKLD